MCQTIRAEIAEEFAELSRVDFRDNYSLGACIQHMGFRGEFSERNFSIKPRPKGVRDKCFGLNIDPYRIVDFSRTLNDTGDIHFSMDRAGFSRARTVAVIKMLNQQSEKRGLEPIHDFSHFIIKPEKILSTITIYDPLPIEPSVMEFIRHFGDDNRCYDFLEFIRWSDGIICPHCGSDKKPYSVPRRTQIQRRTYRCSGFCNNPFNVLTGTIFSGSRIEINKWMFCFYTNSIHRKSFSSSLLGKNIGNSQKSSWQLQRKIRSVLTQDKITLSGIVEIDEAFVGSDKKSKYKYKFGAISTRKTPVMGLIERGGKVIFRSIPDRKTETLLSIVNECVAPSSTIYTDSWVGYKSLPAHFVHDYILHSAGEYVRGAVHTNNIEGAWGFLKKSIRNAHHCVSGKHLQSYLDEAAWKFNTRHLSTNQRFCELVKKCLISNQRPQAKHDY